jgi:hypothetical protein
MTVAFWGFCMLVLGILAILAALNDVRLVVKVRRQGMTTTAEVVGINTHRSGVPGGTTRRNPVLRFATTDDEVVTTELRLGKLRDVSVGDRIDIRYLPKRPKVISLWNSGFPFSSTFWAVLGGAVFIVFGVRMMLS